MNPRVLVFPVAVAAIAALDGCSGISINDPSVRLCQSDDTVQVGGVLANGQKVKSAATVVFEHDQTHCRKRAA